MEKHVWNGKTALVAIDIWNTNNIKFRTPLKLQQRTQCGDNYNSTCTPHQHIGISRHQHQKQLEWKQQQHHLYHHHHLQHQQNSSTYNRIRNGNNRNNNNRNNNRMVRLRKRQDWTTAITNASAPQLMPTTQGTSDTTPTTPLEQNTSETATAAVATKASFKHPLALIHGNGVFRYIKLKLEKLHQCLTIRSQI